MPTELASAEHDFDAGARFRIALTTSCRATDPLPKVAGAGEVVDGVQTMHNGVRIEQDCYCGPWMTEIIRRLRGHHEPQEEVVFFAMLDRLATSSGPAPVILELGSNWAYYSLSVLQRWPAARAFMVEPDPAFLDVGRRNFALNGRRGTFHQAAAGAAAMPPQPFECESDGVVRDVPTESLPSLLERFDLDRIDILLADVQGAELAILEGGRDAIERGAVRFAFFSTHHHAICGDPLIHQRCLDLAGELGGSVIAEHTVAESFSGDGLIVVSFDRQDAEFSVEIPHARAVESLFGDPLADVATLTSERDAARAAAAAAGDERDAALTARDAAQGALGEIRRTRWWLAHERLVGAAHRVRARR